MDKPRRNDPCPCGSGRKYKNCCLENDRAQPAPLAASASPTMDGNATAPEPVAPTPSSMTGVRICLFHKDQTMVVTDLRAALEEMGCELLVFRIQTQKKDDGAEQTRVDGHEDYVGYVYERIDAFDPELILTSSCFGFDGAGSIQMIAELKEIPCVNWIVDAMDNFSETVFDPDFNYATTVVFDRVYAEIARDRGSTVSFHLPLGTNPTRLRKGLRHSWRPPAPVVFVGKTGMEIEVKTLGNFMRAVKGNEEKAKIVLDEIVQQGINALKANPDRTTKDFLRELAPTNPQYGFLLKNDGLCALVASMVEFRASFDLRKGVINRIDAAPVAVVGGADWDGHLTRAQRVNPVPFEIISAVYRNSPINLNLSRYQLKSGVTQRVFDVPAAGGFLLSDYRSGIDELLELDKEIVCFDDIADLNTKIRYYLDHPQERLAIIQAGQKRILEEHTYARRAEQLFFGLQSRGIFKGYVAQGAVTQKPMPEKWLFRLCYLAGRLRAHGRPDLANTVLSKMGPWGTEQFNYDALAMKLIQAKQGSVALEVLEAAIPEFPRPSMISGAALLSFQAGDKPKARDYAKRALELLSEDAKPEERKMLQDILAQAENG